MRRTRPEVLSGSSQSRRAARAARRHHPAHAAEFKGGLFAPVVDWNRHRDTFKKPTQKTKQAHVPLLAGWNRDERAGILSKDMTVDKWKAFATGPRAGYLTTAQRPTSFRAAEPSHAGAVRRLGTALSVLKAGVPCYTSSTAKRTEGKYAWGSSDELGVRLRVDAAEGGAEWRLEAERPDRALRNFATAIPKGGAYVDAASSTALRAAAIGSRPTSW